MTNLGLLPRLWRYLFGDPPPVEIWQTEREEFLRDEKTVECDWFGYTYWKVYAIHQRSLTTDNTRIIEDWRVS